MGKMIGFTCSKCGFEVKAGTTQPYFVMRGSLTDKYCPKTEQIVRIFRLYGMGEPQICCQDKEWQDEFGDPLLCRDCKGECLKDLEMPAAEGEGDSQWYKCPRCGSDLDRSCMVSFNCID